VRMHEYSIDKNPKSRILFYLALFSIGVATLIQWISDSVFLEFIPVLAIPTVSVYLGLYTVFNRYLWKNKFVRRFLLVPDLNGTWVCDGETCLKNGKQADFQWSATITINQSWSKILIRLKTPQSESKSISASIFHEEGVGYRLLYQYDNKPNADQQDLRNHSGSSELLFDESITSAEGAYFTDRHRTTVGTMKLKRMES
jgi:hypothetical protein